MARCPGPQPRSFARRGLPLRQSAKSLAHRLRLWTYPGRAEGPQRDCLPCAAKPNEFSPLRYVLLLTLLLGAGAALADGVNWGDLSPSQQALLKNQQAEWANLSIERQATLARGAERWLALTPEEQNRARVRLERYKQMTPAQRQDVLAKREQFRALAPERQRILHERHEQFKKLPVEEQKQIREAYGQSRRQSSEQNRQLRECLNREADGEAVDCSRYTAPEKSPRNMDPNKDAPGVRLPKL